MPLLDEWIANPEPQAEMFSASSEKLCMITREVASAMFPNVVLHDSPNIAYFNFKLCNSYPKFNIKGRGFMPHVLSKSFASANDQLIDWEHQLRDHGVGTNDRIIGHVKATRFHIPDTVAELASSPTRLAKEVASFAPIPVDALGALFLRAQGVQRAIDNHLAKREKWAVSMECGHHWSDAQFYYRGEFIPACDAELAMRDCVTPSRIADFKGHKLNAVLGGFDKQVNFWGVGFTKDPADTDADIYNFSGGTPRELASKKVFYMPLMSFEGQAAEVASANVDKAIAEVASIEVLGETEPNEPDGHRHFILSNLMVMPSVGDKPHQHHLQTFSISRGSNPAVTGHTDSHTEYGPEVSSGKTHMHLVKIPLKGKYKTDGSEDTTHIDPLVSEEASAMSTILKDQLAKQAELLAKLATAPDLAAAKIISGELASVQAVITTEVSKQGTEAERKTFLEGLVAAGTYVTKEKADAAVQEAVAAKEKELKAATDAALAEQAKRSERLLKCQELKIDLATEFTGLKNAAGGTLTLKDRLEAIPLDANGDTQFQADLSLWAVSAKKEDPVVTTVATSADGTTVVKQETTAAEAASKGAKPGVKQIPMAGAGPTAEKEVASGGGSASSGTATAVPKHLAGRRKVS